MKTPARELVDCTVQVTPSLARRLRKAALAEHQGQDASSALMAAADRDPKELETMRAQVQDLTSDLDEERGRAELLTATVGKLTAELSKARAQLGARDEASLEQQKEREAATKRIAELADTIEQTKRDLAINRERAQKFRDTLLSIPDDPASRPTLDDDLSALDEQALSVIGSLKEVLGELKRQLAPLHSALEAGGMRAWIVRRVLN